MKRLFILALVLSSSAQAYGQSTDTARIPLMPKSGGMARQIALGGGGFGLLGTVTSSNTIMVNPFSVDPQFMTHNPAWASYYDDLLWTDLGTASNSIDDGIGQMFGVTFGLGDALSVGVLLARDVDRGVGLMNPGVITGQTDITPFPSLGDLSHAWELLGSYDLGTAKIGLGVSYFTKSESASVDTFQTESTSSLDQIGLNLGTIIGIGEGSLLELAATILLPSLSITGGNDTSQSANYTIFGVNTRALLPIEEALHLVPFVNFYASTGKSTITGTPSDLPSSTSLDVGVGVNYAVGRFRFMGGPSISSYSSKIARIPNFQPLETRQITVLPRWNLGAEFVLLDWLTGRLGYLASSAKETIERERTETINEIQTSTRYDLFSPFGAQTPSGVSLGIGMDLGGLKLDATVNEEFIRRGFGALTSTASFGFVTMSYKF